MDLLKLLGRICKEFRTESGIPVKEIADKCGYTPANVYKFERGESNNALILLTYLWYGLDLDPRELWIEGGSALEWQV